MERSAGVSLWKRPKRIFRKFNGHYMFPESHAYAFGITAYQASWLKYHYPLEFYVGLFNEQPMGFYNLETLKEDAKRHGIRVLNPDINRSVEECVIEAGVHPSGLPECPQHWLHRRRGYRSGAAEPWAIQVGGRVHGADRSAAGCTR